MGIGTILPATILAVGCLFGALTNQGKTKLLYELGTIFFSLILVTEVFPPVAVLDWKRAVVAIILCFAAWQLAHVVSFAYYAPVSPAFFGPAAAIPFLVFAALMLIGVAYALLYRPEVLPQF